MRLLLGLTVLVVTVGALYSAPEDRPPSTSEDTLKRESAQRSLNGYFFHVWCCQIKAFFLFFYFFKSAVPSKCLWKLITLISWQSIVSPAAKRRWHVVPHLFLFDRLSAFFFFSSFLDFEESRAFLLHFLFRLRTMWSCTWPPCLYLLSQSCRWMGRNLLMRR